MKKTAVFDGTRRHNYEEYTDVCETVQSYYGTGGGNTPIVVIYDEAVIYRIGGINSKAWLDGKPNTGIAVTTVSRTLDENGGNPCCNQGGGGDR